MTNSETARTLTEKLELDTLPVALAFRDAPPENCAVSQDPVPSACGFWRKAETGLFFAPAEAHFHCPIGAIVMGFDLPEPVEAELMEVVGTMSACGYVADEEPTRLPANPKRGAKGLLYGPLAEFPGPPDAVLAWLTPAQAMLWNEASGDVAWGGETTPLVTGRPACAAIPASLGARRAALSAGCAGMRIFTGIGDERLLAVLPGTALANFCVAIERVWAANARMAEHYRARLAGLGLS